MNLKEAIWEFEERRKSKFAVGDRRMIERVIDELGLTSFALNESLLYFKDVDDRVHVHPTMILARIPFTGSIDRGPEPFKSFPHFMELSTWTSASSTSIDTPFTDKLTCDICFCSVPTGSECPVDGHVH